MNLYPWGMFLLGLFIGGALVQWRAEQRERMLRAELLALIDAVVQDTGRDRTRAMSLAITRAWGAVRE